MHTSLEMQWSWVQAMNGLRTEFLESLSDDDLQYRPGGSNLPLGELIVGMGNIERSYTASFIEFAQTWEQSDNDTDLTSNTEALKSWFAGLDTNLEAALDALDGDSVQRQIERPGGGGMPVEMQLQTYIQALFIYFGKFVVYLNAMGKPLPQSMRDYIG